MIELRVVFCLLVMGALVSLLALLGFDGEDDETA